MLGGITKGLDRFDRIKMPTVRTINLFANFGFDIGTTPPTGASIAPKMIQKFQRYFHDLKVESKNLRVKPKK